MKALVSRYASPEGEVFNDEVANRLEQVPGMVVRRRVKNVGSGGSVDI